MSTSENAAEIATALVAAFVCLVVAIITGVLYSRLILKNEELEKKYQHAVSYAAEIEASRMSAEAALLSTIHSGGDLSETVAMHVALLRRRRTGRVAQYKLLCRFWPWVQNRQMMERTFGFWRGLVTAKRKLKTVRPLTRAPKHNQIGAAEPAFPDVSESPFQST